MGQPAALAFKANTMNNFFRRIRQSLLAENKFSKYLLYAVGEILLVVIGILIALQINNWNEFNKERENEKTMAWYMQKQKIGTPFKEEIA